MMEALFAHGPLEPARIVSEVLKLLPELSRAVQQSMPEDARREGVSAAQVKALVHLAEYGPQTMSRLAEGLAITTPSATGLINPLVDMGFVVRERDLQDRRVVRVALSEQAALLAREILERQRRDVAEALSGMTPQEQQIFLEGLGRLVQVYGAHRRNRGGLRSGRSA